MTATTVYSFALLTHKIRQESVITHTARCEDSNFVSRAPERDTPSSRCRQSKGRYSEVATSSETNATAGKKSKNIMCEAVVDEKAREQLLQNTY